jgi:hypothetical protein
MTASCKPRMILNVNWGGAGSLRVDDGGSKKELGCDPRKPTGDVDCRTDVGEKG